MLNGKRQPWLRCLGAGAPRTTRTQEGLATFAEIITGAMDINRLRRIALRVLRLEEALAGADFIEVFRAFLAAGQSDVESYRSAVRIFRGGDVRGRVCFTKDGAYLEGLLLVTAFIKRALHENRADTLRLRSAGGWRWATWWRCRPAATAAWSRPRITCRRGRAIRNGYWRRWRSPPRPRPCAWTRSPSTVSPSTRRRRWTRRRGRHRLLCRSRLIGDARALDGRAHRAGRCVGSPMRMGSYRGRGGMRAAGRRAVKGGALPVTMAA